VKIKDLIKEELKKRESGIVSKEDLVELTEKRLKKEFDIKLKKLTEKLYKEFDVLLEDQRVRVAVEKKYNGFRAMIHRKGDTVKIFSDQNKDITFPFPTIVEQAKKLTPKDFILDCELVPYVNGKPMGRDYTARYIGAVKSKREIDDSNVRFFAFDILYLDKPLISLQWYERKKILDTLSWTKNIKEAKSYVVNNRFDLRRIVEKLSELEGSEGAIIKRFDGVYSPGKESDAWIKYRVEIPLELVVLGELPVKGSEDTVRYQLGIYLKQEETKRIDPKYLTKLNNRYVLQLGNSFNTNIEANRGDILLVNVEEIWRHKKGNKYHYSLHKPRVRKRLDKESSSSLNYLEEKVVSRGYEIIESEFEFRKEKDNEGREIEIADFPKRLQNNFKELKNEWMPYVMQWHYRGHKITEKERKKENIDDKYIYKLDSLHVDARHLVKKGYLEGFTILSPTSTDLNVPDNLTKGKSARKGKIRVVLKLIEPKSWLRVKGIADIGEPGSTPTAPGVFVIVSKGKYRIHEVTDHKIRIEYKSERGNIDLSPLKKAEKKGILIERYPGRQLKDLTGMWQYQIAHIGDRHIILLRLLEDKKTNKLDEEIEKKIDEFSLRTNQLNKEQMREVINLTLDGVLTRPEIARKYDVSKNLIYRLQKTCNLI